MSTIRPNNSYGLNQPVNLDAPFPIASRRNPIGADKAPLGQIWVNRLTNSAFVLTSVVNNVANWVAVVGGAGVFTDLTINPGPTNITGAFTLVSGAGNTAHIADDASAHNTFVGSATGNSSTTIQSGTGAMTVSSAAGGSVVLNQAEGNIAMSEVTASVASPTATVVINARVGRAVFTGFTTAAAGLQTYTITNNTIATNSLLFVTVANGGAADAQITMTSVFKQAGSFAVDTHNFGAAALNGDVEISFWNAN